MSTKRIKSKDALVKERIEILWSPTNVWYKGTIMKYSKKSGLYHVKYDSPEGVEDEEWEWVDLDHVNKGEVVVCWERLAGENPKGDSPIRKRSKEEFPGVPHSKTNAPSSSSRSSG